METVRIASLQYFIRPVATFDDFRAQVSGLVETAADYRARIVVFPEYFTLQLLTLGDVRRPVSEQVRELATTGATQRVVATPQSSSGSTPLKPCRATTRLNPSASVPPSSSKPR